MLEGLAHEWTDATEGAETWSPYVIVGQVIHGERTDWIPRARLILAQGAADGARLPQSALPVPATQPRLLW
jgi:hypothetical protein